MSFSFSLFLIPSVIIVLQNGQPVAINSGFTTKASSVHNDSDVTEVIRKAAARAERFGVPDKVSAKLIAEKEREAAKQARIDKKRAKFQQMKERRQAAKESKRAEKEAQEALDAAQKELKRKRAERLTRNFRRGMTR